MSEINTALAYSTDSAGMHPSHTLPIKLRAITDAGFTQAELAFSDLETYAGEEFPGYRKLDERGSGDLFDLVQAAGKVKELCAELGLSILAVHQFSCFEGYEDAQKRAIGFERAAAWLKVLTALNCQMLQVSSTPDPLTSNDYDVIARDLRILADEAAILEPPIRIAYEMCAWGAHVNTWEHTWEVCKRVDRPNFGLCLDTFQICGTHLVNGVMSLHILIDRLSLPTARAYADPTAANGLLQHPPEGSAIMQLVSSLKALAVTLPPEKIFYLQISDGSRRIPPIVLRKVAEDQGISPLNAWSNAWRPIPDMDHIYPRRDRSSWGGYLPVLEVCEAAVKTGWRGPWSYEVFLGEDMSREDEDVPVRWTKNAKMSHRLLLKYLKERGY
ncbi:xylose isomerase-like protein [Trametes gibbosa]|nr:xylose isomerase-like protein [Trametes gibbosa]